MLDVLHWWSDVEGSPLCIPAQLLIEHMKVLQSFKKGVAHTLCCTPSFWRSTGTLHTVFINVCAECKTERGKDGGCINIHSIILSFLRKVVHTVLTERLCHHSY
ncbi:uncharacterized protein LOC123519260 [Portunus trituberculatus]|uniref:uncharacterized protein LOC123510838 n=1 Tax=Portunus trituberculatus TaxID=210409 RepID=UPI001E1D1C2C|nr:uncharacterized protein LOC123510838 [Portunus trituberculatus]XP_045136326.1 uncharacterized protein LOC123519260 [Portunus trituberculatus]